jgi:D-serine deaminase-like pyridoxal phosphate-dependent protein
MNSLTIDRQAWSWVTRPTLMIDRRVVRHNIETMVAKTAALGLRMRPHFKTHQSAEIGGWFREVGVDRITVSSIEMAAYFADAGWQDITIAFPANIRAVATLNALAHRIHLGLLISDASAIPALEQGLTAPVNAWIEVDTGDGRSGFGWDADLEIADAASAIQKTSKLKLAGLLGHAGYTYRAQGGADVLAAHGRDIGRLRHAATVLRAGGFRDIEVSTGDTPGCSLGHDFEGADEVRPGNFVFYDVQQSLIGSCGLGQVGVAMAAPVVAVYPQRNEVVVHAGGVHLAKDSIVDPQYGTIFGRIALPQQRSWSAAVEGCYLRSISQEHGIAVLSADLMRQVRVGDLLAVLPVHSCMAADLMMRLHPVDAGVETAPILMMKAERVVG